MQKEITIKLVPSEIENEQIILKKTRNALGIKSSDELFIKKIKSSLDARKHPIHYQLKLKAFINEKNEFETEKENELIYREVHNATEPLHIIGAGPAGLFCALRCLD
jgi:uncharacterized FAD-dependent dehydrogenase